ncbi:MAG: hypothetical protein HOM96_05525 [Rickettsiales bacterium]|jgi:hypothetical protein|nr:hypothetical protein [Rickettsiales bacterium]
MDKELLKEILSLVRDDKDKHNVKDGDQPTLSEVIYGLKYGDKDPGDERLKSQKKESEIDNSDIEAQLGGQEQIFDEKAVSKKLAKKMGRSKKEILEFLQEEQVVGIMDAVSSLSASDISSPELLLELEKLLLYKDVKVLHQVLQNNEKYKEAMSNKLNVAAFNIVNNSKTGQEFAR